MSIGEVLAAARRQAGLTVTQVSQRTRIRETIIAGIERDDFAACGGDFYARGHIRALARAAGADPGPLVAEFDSSHGTPPTGTAAAAPEPPAELPARFWRAAARIAARAAIVTLGLHRDAGFVAAGVLAAGTAVAAQAEARFRGRRGRASDLGGVIAATLALTAILTCLLGLAASHRLR